MYLQDSSDAGSHEQPFCCEPASGGARSSGGLSRQEPSHCTACCGKWCNQLSPSNPVWCRITMSSVVICSNSIPPYTVYSSAISYTYKFSRNVIFKVLQSTDHLQNFHPWNFIGKTLTCISRRAEYLVILKNKSWKYWICDILKIYMPRKFVRIQ